MKPDHKFHFILIIFLALSSSCSVKYPIAAIPKEHKTATVSDMLEQSLDHDGRIVVKFIDGRRYQFDQVNKNSNNQYTIQNQTDGSVIVLNPDVIEFVGLEDQRKSRIVNNAVFGGGSLLALSIYLIWWMNNEFLNFE